MKNYFTLAEFDSKLEPGSGARMNPIFLTKLNAGREIYGKKITINNGMRVNGDFERLVRAGYKPSRTSAHFIGRAADIRPTSGALQSWHEWLELLEAMWKAGFRRFGIMNGVLHVDDDPSKPSPTAWSYPVSAKATPQQRRHYLDIYSKVSLWLTQKRRELKSSKP